MKPTLRTRLAGAAAFTLCFALAAPAHAAGSNMPWEQPLQQVLESIEEPVAKIIAVIIIIVTGLTLAFGSQYAATSNIVGPVASPSGRNTTPGYEAPDADSASTATPNPAPTWVNIPSQPTSCAANRAACP